MKEISCVEITRVVESLCVDACCTLDDSLKTLIHTAKDNETSPVGQTILSQIVDNIAIAESDRMPLCQDTGMAVFFLELGQDVHIVDGLLTDAINEGVRRGYTNGLLRKSVLTPLGRKNTNDNTPAIIHTNVVAGDKLKISFAPKGFGSENMSQLRMLKPSQGVEGVKDFIVEAVKTAGGNPCPPIILGIGIGGTMEYCSLLAKRALLRTAGTHHPDAAIAALETELLDLVNATGIGPQGFGGNTTALAVHIETYHTHIAGLPVAVNFQCHVARHAERVL
jgi:fumarate hydratase subunit alpha